MSADLDARWVETLDQIEADIARAQSVVGSPATPQAPGPLLDPSDYTWITPTGLGPIPEALRARAQALLNRQQALQRELTEAIQATRAHLNVVGKLRLREAPQAVYVDTLG